MADNARFEGRSISLPRAYWNILEMIQSSMCEPSLSGVVKNILDRFFVEKTWLEKQLGAEKASTARKMLEIKDTELLIERKC